MPKKVLKIKSHAYAILLYHIDHRTRKPKVFLVKANGPRYWGRNSEQCWGLPKGKQDFGETAFQAAEREFKEETGSPLPQIPYTFFLHLIRPEAQREITVFSGQLTEQNTPQLFIESNQKTVEFPVGSGKYVSYKETVAGEWFTLKEANKLMLSGQKIILTQLSKQLKMNLKF